VFKKKYSRISDFGIYFICVVVTIVILLILYFSPKTEIPKRVEITVSELSFVLQDEKLLNFFNLNDIKPLKVIFANFKEIDIPSPDKILIHSPKNREEFLGSNLDTLILKPLEGIYFPKVIFSNVVFNEFSLKKETQIGIEVFDEQNDYSVIFSMSKGKSKISLTCDTLLELNAENIEINLKKVNDQEFESGKLFVFLNNDKLIKVITDIQKKVMKVSIQLLRNIELIEDYESIKIKKLTSLDGGSLKLIEDGNIIDRHNNLNYQALSKGDLLEIVGHDFMEIEKIRISSKGIELILFGKFKRLYNTKIQKSYLPSLLEWLYANKIIIIMVSIINFSLVIANIIVTNRKK